ncbi:MAG: hypothetical protein IJ092_02290, partial [Atopobiaceae bacterium]|nr:hypothetical protein [Atopobiaceae bacterium]
PHSSHFVELCANLTTKGQLVLVGLHAIAIRTAVVQNLAKVGSTLPASDHSSILCVFKMSMKKRLPMGMKEMARTKDTFRHLSV